MEKVFEVKDGDKTRELCIVPPSPKVSSESQRVYNQAFKKALQDGMILRGVLEQKLTDEGLWDDEKEASYDALLKQLAAYDYALNSGKENGVKLKLSRAKEIALDLRSKRRELNALLQEKNSHDQVTAEAISDDARFNFLLAACVIDNLTRKPVFANYDEYLNSTNKALAFSVAQKFANYMYGLDEDFEQKLTENKFLRKFEFCDAEGRLLDSDGKFVDSEGNRVDEFGYLLDENDSRIDINGNPILEAGTNVETVEFEDDVTPKKRKKVKSDKEPVLSE